MFKTQSADKRERTINKLLVLVIVLVLTAAAAAVEAVKTPDANEGSITAGADINNAQEPGASVEEGSLGGEIQSLTFRKDMRIKDALRFLAAKYRKNIVPSAKVDGITPVTTLYEVSFEQALDSILGYDFKYDQDGNFIRVYTADEYKKIKEDKSRMTYKVFTLYYVSAAEAAALVGPVLSSSGSVKGSSAAGVGISSGTGGATSQAGGDSLAHYDTIVVFDYPENIRKVEEVVKTIDVKPMQVLVEATILSATLTEGTQLGIDWNTLDGVSISDLATIGSSGLGGAETTGFTTFEKTSGLKVGITDNQVTALIKALESVTDITIMANPKILALNKQMGTVFIGQKIGYRDRTTISDTGQATIGEVKFLDTGTKLSFRPYIANDGYIRMDIYPKDSTGELDQEGIPTETTAELTTNIMVKDGHTIIIGGLFRDAITTTKSQIPLLGDIPIVGVLFRGTSDTSKRQEIIVMLTPHIINEPQQTDPDNRMSDIGRKRYGGRAGMLGISRAKIAEDHYASAVKYYANNQNVKALCELDSALALRPTYLEALRLRETIITETEPANAGRLERIMADVIEKQQAPNWRRY